MQQIYIFCLRQRNWSEEGKTGRLLILFVGLILSSYPQGWRQWCILYFPPKMLLLNNTF